MNDRFIDLYDDYVHSDEPRRVFLQKLVRAAGGAAAAAAILPWLEGTGAEAAMVAPDDRRLVTRMESFIAEGQMNVYVAHPAKAQLLPAVVVIHENRGLTPHIQDIARRVALGGFLAVAPDMISPAGGTPTNQDKARDMLYGIDKKVIDDNLVATGRYAQGHTNSTGSVGSVGFCWGGAASNNLAVMWGDLKAAVAYYGRQPKSGIDRIRAALLLHYASNDKGVNAGIDAYMKALKAAGKNVEMHQYPDTRHAFNNDTRPARYSKAAADLAWQHTIAHFKKHLA